MTNPQFRVSAGIRTITLGTRHAPVSSMDHDTVVSGKIIGCAIEVHKELGPGLLESAYHSALCAALKKHGLSFTRERPIALKFQELKVGAYKPDLIVEATVVVEVKAAARFHPIFRAQLLTYLRITKLHVGLILDFNRPVMKDGITRVVL